MFQSGLVQSSSSLPVTLQTMLLPLWLMLVTLQPPPHVFGAVVSAGRCPILFPLCLEWAEHAGLLPSDCQGRAGSHQLPRCKTHENEGFPQEFAWGGIVWWQTAMQDFSPALLEARGRLTASSSAAVEAICLCVWVSLVLVAVFFYFVFLKKKLVQVCIGSNAQLERMI